nr:hypothetical protein L203_05033 [Cryptococcus depauperatus CBS 7841]
MSPKDKHRSGKSPKKRDKKKDEESSKGESKASAKESSVKSSNKSMGSLWLRHVFAQPEDLRHLRGKLGLGESSSQKTFLPPTFSARGKTSTSTVYRKQRATRRSVDSGLSSTVFTTQGDPDSEIETELGESVRPPETTQDGEGGS